MKSYVDIHCHPFKEYYDNPDEVVQNAFNRNVKKLFIVSTDKENTLEVLDFCKHFDFLYPIIGIHPNDAWSEDLVDFIEANITKDVIAIGEVGLDYHYDDSPSHEMQQKVFKRFLDLGLKKDLPIMIHSRDSFSDLYQILSEEKYKNSKVVFHTFSGDISWAKKFLELGCYFSFSGVCTFKNAKDTQEVISLIPLDKIFTETDSPYLTPCPYRGQTNFPEYVVEVANSIAKIKGIGIDVLNEHINQNIESLFKISKYEK